ncbi:MAG TPA: TSUP family transporter, partial [Deltaproteobacteria bacterium]|nr:TSUP family transporter [Deltaproteobacteria bacterium]
NFMRVVTIIIVSLIFMIGSLWGGTALGAVTGDPLMNLQENVSHAVAKVRPSVVCVKAKKKKQLAGDAGAGVMWYESIGSGIIVDERGYILTNHHVVADAESISVNLWRSRNHAFAARMVHSDTSQDMAVLKIDGNERFVPAALGDSDRIEAGDWVIAVGSPFGFEHSATLGIVSDLHRDLMIGGASYKGMIQTDAVINQGNSGGPLIDIFGRVVGVGTAIYAPEGTYTGIGFAIPINRAKHFFTRVTGAIRAAAQVPVKNKEAVNLNKPMPQDAVHQKFSDCTQCHTITQKSPVSTQAVMTHPMVGACDKCHIMTNDKVAKGPTTVANVRPVPAPPGTPEPRADFITNIIIKLALITLVISIVFTMIGVGGGFMYVPILISCGIGFHTAATTSLVMLTFAQISALYIFFKSGLVDLKLAMVLEFPTMIGAFTGGMLSDHFNASLLCVLFACVLFLASYSMMQDQAQLQGVGSTWRISPWQWEHEFRGQTVRMDMAMIMPLTFMVGFVGGLLGLAGGWLKVPIMVLLLNVPMKVAVATSSLMVPVTGFAGFLGHSFLGHFEPKLAICLSVVTVIGAQIGSRLSISAESSLLRFMFAFVLSLVGLWMILMVFR